MEQKNTPLTPKEIYQTIKERPYKDGEALIWEFALAFAVKFYEWENTYNGDPEQKEGYAESIVNKFHLEYYDKKETPRRRS